MDSATRLRVATRIHFGMLRYLDSGIDVQRMLLDAGYAREVLFVCRGSGDEELLALAAEFEPEAAAAPKPRPMTAKMRVMPSPEELARARRRAQPPAPARAEPEAEGDPQPAPPPADEEFDFERPPELPRWLNPKHWLRRVKPKP